MCCLALTMVIRTLAVGPGVSYASYLSFAPHQALGLLVSQWLLFSTRVPYLHDGVTPAGSGIVYPQS